MAIPDIKSIFSGEFQTANNVILIEEDSGLENQSQTNAVFSEKWEKYSKRKFRNRKSSSHFSGTGTWISMALLMRMT